MPQVSLMAMEYRHRMAPRIARVRRTLPVVHSNRTGWMEVRMTRQTTKSAVVSLLLALILWGGCADDAEPAQDGGVENNCAPGLKPMGPACVPIFDECQDDEVPMLGGGCMRVGVKECLDGWGIAGPPDWKCKPIGPPRTCLKGWEKVAGGWCEPILPETKCPAGMMEKIGYRSCQPIGDCGTGTWGNIKTTANTIYVDQGHTGIGGKGTKTDPYRTIGEAINQATAGDHIALAAGTYNEEVIIVRKVIIEGRCAQMVTIDGGNNFSALRMTKWASGAIVRDVTITSNSRGIWIDRVVVTIERVAVQGCEGHGIVVGNAATLNLRNSLVAGNRELGLILFSAKAKLEQVVVRGTREDASNNMMEAGIAAQSQSVTSEPSELSIQDSLVSENRGVGISLHSTKVTLERTIVRDTRERAKDSYAGEGIRARFHPGQKWSSDLLLRDTLVASNREVGIRLYSSKAMLERTVVRNTQASATDNNWGLGISAEIQSGYGPSELTVRNSLVVGNRDIGVALYSSKAMIERTIVRDTRERASNNKFGRGIDAAIQPGYGPSELTVRDSLVAGNREVGIALMSSKATLERTVVRDTHGQASIKEDGTGIAVGIQPDQNLSSELTVCDSLVTRNRTAGIGIFSSKATVERTVVRDTREQASDNEFGSGITAVAQLGQSKPSELTLSDSLVVGNRNVGIILASSKVTVDRTVVRDTRGKVSDGRFGSGILAQVGDSYSFPSELKVRDSLIARNKNTGLTLIGSSGELTRCTISGTQTDGYFEFGDGIVIGTKSTLDVEDTLVELSARAGFLFWNAVGSIHSSLIYRNVFAIDLEKGSAPLIGKDNLMIENQVNHVTLGRGLGTSPLPMLPKLFHPDAGPDSGPDAGVSAQ